MFTSLPPGLAVIFEGSNFSRLLGGLWTSFSITFLALLVAVPLGAALGLKHKVAVDQRSSQGVLGVRAHNTTTCSIVPGVLYSCKNIRS
ncbi:MAG: hypothetical protein LBP35_05845 [Candidatus Ancillula trichonymphae]|jgi:hypothetical protein|nr:hypothetical protein [Candidatus Ancillula trichonymphae]